MRKETPSTKSRSYNNWNIVRTADNPPNAYLEILLETTEEAEKLGRKLEKWELGAKLH